MAREQDGEKDLHLRVVSAHVPDQFTAVAWSPDGKQLATGSTDSRVRIWDPSSGKLLRTLEGHANTVRSVSFSPDGKALASGSFDKTVRIWDPSSGKLLRTLEGHANTVLSVSFSPDGKALASGSDDRTVRIWDPSSGKLLRTLEGHADQVLSVSFSPDGKALASGSYDHTVRIWDPSSGKLLRTLEGHANPVLSVSFSPDGKAVVSGSADRTVRVWDVSTGSVLAIHPIRSTHFAVLMTFSAAEASARSFGTTVFGDPDLIAECLGPGASAAPAEETTQVACAKIVLVGESNVGKSFLAHRMATGEPPAPGSIKSTHGMKFWPLPPERLWPQTQVPAGQRRDVVLWDMGGQEEYRLVHQLFLHDTSVALVLLDPTRGTAAFKEAETWNKYLVKQLRDRQAAKLLVGAKLDQPTDTIDHNAVDRLCADDGFAKFCETSAVTGRGLDELCQAVGEAIAWQTVSRPVLFQRVRDEIETRRKRGDVVLYLVDLHRALGEQASEASTQQAVRIVVDQLAQQGTIARSRASTGEDVLVLQVQEIERYAGSLIVAARNNPRGVPALEVRAIARPDFVFPGIAQGERVPRTQEGAVLECTVELLIQHGICFQHEGLLIFPSLVGAPSASEAGAAPPPHAVSLYYDFAGAIDNIYASLVSWLVLAKGFGRLRLSPDGAEFEVKDGGLCGLRKVPRPGGFAHVDVYFEDATPPERRDEFISFVEDHLGSHGVALIEHVKLTCPCGHAFAEETLRQRIARGDKDVVCPVCETRHSLTEGAAAARKRDPKLHERLWALKVEVERGRKDAAQEAIRLLDRAEAHPQAQRPIRLLHLSDLHFDKDTTVSTRLQWLLNDLKLESGLGFKELDYLVVSGDFTDKGCAEGFEKAYEFLSGLTSTFGLSAERCILVPGNHDLAEPIEAYARRRDSKGLRDGEWVQQGAAILVRDPDKYPLRLKPFSDGLFHKFLQRPYPMAPGDQGIAIPFWDHRIQFLTLNSCWEIDEFDRKRAAMHPEAVATVVKQAQDQVALALRSGDLKPGQKVLRIGVWHHAVTAPDYKMKDLQFLGALQKNEVKLALHGDVHEMRRELFQHWSKDKIHIAAAGSFGARGPDRPESIPRLYNVLEIQPDFSAITVHTRRQRTPDGDWDGWFEWPVPGDEKKREPHYTIHLP